MAIGEDLLVTVLISFSLYGYTFQQNCHNMVNHVLDNEQVGRQSHVGRESWEASHSTTTKT